MISALVLVKKNVLALLSICMSKSSTIFQDPDKQGLYPVNLYVVPNTLEIPREKITELNLEWIFFMEAMHMYMLVE